MTKRDFFILIIKILGLYSLVITIFIGIPSSIGFFSIASDNIIIRVVWVVVSFIFSLGLFLLLIDGAGKIVDVLKLEKGFDDDRIELGNLSSEDIIKVSCFMLGGFLIVDNFQDLLMSLFGVYKQSLQIYEYKGGAGFDLFVTVLNIFIGTVLISNFKWIADKLSKR